MNYDEDDTIKITAGKIKSVSTTSAGSVVFKVGSGKITLKNAADKIITYEDADGVKNFYPIDFNSKGTAATLLSAYGKDEFDFEDFDGLKNLDASKVTRALEIEGNKRANKIIGTAKATTSSPITTRTTRLLFSVSTAGREWKARLRIRPAT